METLGIENLTVKDDESSSEDDCMEESEDDLSEDDGESCSRCRCSLLYYTDSHWECMVCCEIQDVQRYPLIDREHIVDKIRDILLKLIDAKKVIVSREDVFKHGGHYPCDALSFEFSKMCRENERYDDEFITQICTQKFGI